MYYSKPTIDPEQRQARLAPGVSIVKSEDGGATFNEEPTSPTYDVGLKTDHHVHARRSRELEPHLRRRRRRTARELRHGQDLHPREQHPGLADLSHRRGQSRSVLGVRRPAGQPLVHGAERDAPLARHPQPGLARDRLQRRHRQGRRQGRLAQGLLLVERRQSVARRSDDRRHDGDQRRVRRRASRATASTGTRR